MSSKLAIAWIIILILSNQPAYTQLTAGIINDPDGYTNLRSGKGANFEIARKIREGEKFEFEADSTNWWPVTAEDGTQGYIHKSKIQPYHIDYGNSCFCKYMGYGESKVDLAGKIGNHDISICGYLQQRNSASKAKFAGFTIYDCTDNKSLEDYGELDDCYLEFVGDKLIITHLANLPAGKGWKLQSTPIYRVIMVETDGEIKTTAGENVFNGANISAEDIYELIEEAQTIKDSGTELDLVQLENYAARLFIGAMKGNKRSKEILINYRDYFHHLDGVIAEERSDYIDYLEKLGLD